jgi:hypothetical protein
VQLFHILALLLTAAAVFSYINHRFLKLPAVIGIMLVALVFSLVLNLPGPSGIQLEQEVQEMLASIDFDATLLHGMLSFLLFAGALHVTSIRRFHSFSPRAIQILTWGGLRGGIWWRWHCHCQPARYATPWLP